MCSLSPNISSISFYGELIKVVPDALCVMCFLWSGSVLLEREEKKKSKGSSERRLCEASLNGLQGYKHVSQRRKIEWATWCEPCRRVLTADLLLIMQLCPGLDLAAPTLFPSPGLQMNHTNTNTWCCLGSHWNIHLVLRGSHQLSFHFIQLLFFSGGARQETLNLHFKFSCDCSFNFSCTCKSIITNMTMTKKSVFSLWCSFLDK